MQLAIMGGGAAGFFAAIHAAEAHPHLKITIYERAATVLGKVKISGGGRCNVCNAEHDPRLLIKGYPRGGKALLGPFNRFCTAETIAFYTSRGVQLKAEADGRVFPVTDDSQTIIDCLLKAAWDAGIQIETQANIREFKPGPDGGWNLIFADGHQVYADKLILTPGASTHVWANLAELGHKIMAPVPSLFTLNIQDERLKDMAGIAVTGAVSVSGLKLMENGPVLITHWGLSGPAVLRLSAWGARELHALNHRFELIVHWVAGIKVEQMVQKLSEMRKEHSKKAVLAHPHFDLPSRLWKKLGMAANIQEQTRWADLSNATIRLFAQELCEGRYQVQSKSANKEEFVTCGGVALEEVNFKTMESKLLPGLYFAGEVLDIDAITGGYNFQAAWTTGAIAGWGL